MCIRIRSLHIKLFHHIRTNVTYVFEKYSSYIRKYVHHILEKIQKGEENKKNVKENCTEKAHAFSSLKEPNIHCTNEKKNMPGNK